jgi:four helix bundle protein
MQDYRKLRVWHRAHALSLDVYRLVRFRGSDRYELASQMRRAAASVPTNIAEGCKRRSPKELAYFLDIAAGSAGELRYQLLLARDLALIEPGDYARLDDEADAVQAMLCALRQRVSGEKRRP